MTLDIEAAKHPGQLIVSSLSVVWGHIWVWHVDLHGRDSTNLDGGDIEACDIKVQSGSGVGHCYRLCNLYHIYEDAYYKPVWYEYPTGSYWGRLSTNVRTNPCSRPMLLCSIKLYARICPTNCGMEVCRYMCYCSEAVVAVVMYEHMNLLVSPKCIPKRCHVWDLHDVGGLGGNTHIYHVHRHWDNYRPVQCDISSLPLDILDVLLQTTTGLNFYYL